jgi:hypothetical protein
VTIDPVRTPSVRRGLNDQQAISYEPETEVTLQVVRSEADHHGPWGTRLDPWPSGCVYPGAEMEFDGSTRMGPPRAGCGA